MEIILKEETLKKYHQELEKLQKAYTPHDPAYRKALHQRALLYWQKWDRKNIFRIAEKTGEAF